MQKSTKQQQQAESQGGANMTLNLQAQEIIWRSIRKS